ncbi:MAG: hypothetical protein HQK78_14935, partial [Desulfobacterales bacterium]|nr:hypothetical protein [Desulfobacterales bacterium]
PIFAGKNGLDYLDDLYNSISKASAYYIPKLKEDAKKFDGTNISVNIKMKSEEDAKQIEPLFGKSSVNVTRTGTELKVEGDLGKIFANCLEDTDTMFANDGAKVSGKYNYEEKRVLYNWHKALSATDKALKKQEKFKEANFIGKVMKKGVECSYNYYKIKPQKITERVGVVLFSLIFYVVYTMWYGFSILLMFEGWGIRLSH